MEKNPKIGHANSPLSNQGQGFPGLFIKTVFLLRPGPAAATFLAFLISVLVVVGNVSRRGREHPEEFVLGQVADRNVAAEISISYIDKEATERFLEDQKHLVPAVFRYSYSAAGEIRNAYTRFREFAENRIQVDAGVAAFVQAVEAEYPRFFSINIMEAFARHPERIDLLEYAAVVLEQVIDMGIFEIIPSQVESYNPEILELIPQGSSEIEQQQWLSYREIITRSQVREFIDKYISGETIPIASPEIAGDILLPFIKENVYFSFGDTLRRVEKLREQTDPVMKYIERGKLIIRKGFPVTEDNLRALEALRDSQLSSDVRSILGIILLLLMLYSLLIFLGGPLVVGRRLSNAEIYLVSALSALYLVGAALVSNLSVNSEIFLVSLVFPTALVVMLTSILINPRLAMVLAMVLPLGAFFSGSYDASEYIFALFSGAVAAYALQGAEKRMDLLRAGLVIAGINCVALTAILLFYRIPGSGYPGMLVWAAFNGLGSGMLVLGFLPPLEHALNAATAFRLIELSDLNAPILKRLFSAAPGTYSHSIMVANLAEAGAQEIGANPLLARVGAYYHDLGKMENPDYFVENQTVYNRHNDLAPRLSATVIRSHVKIGVEKARSLGLPREVTEIVAEHHGNSLITWFYNEALKREGQVNPEDFSYPGNPPRSRESAVVMLADMTEAAVRTLKKPTAAKIEKFIQELISAKVEHGQLAQSELTFRDLETIKNAFVRVLAGHYHSRIEYPKLPDLKAAGGERKGSGNGERGPGNGEKSPGEKPPEEQEGEAE